MKQEAQNCHKGRPGKKDAGNNQWSNANTEKILFSQKERKDGPGGESTKPSK